MPMNDFEVLEPVGSGAFASVFKVRRIEDGKVYALKKVKLARMSDKEAQDTLNEVRFLASIRHNNIVGYMESFLDKDGKELCVVMEFCGCGDLAAKVQRYRRRRRYIEENVIWAYFVQALSALNHLHTAGLIHRDVKPANCFLSEDGSLKLGDLNVSKRIAEDALCQTQIGTPYYMSPEIWASQPYDTKSDMWALGCTMYELVALRPPFTASSFSELQRNITSGSYPSLSKRISPALKGVIDSLLRVNAQNRPSAQELLNDPGVRNRVRFTDDLAERGNPDDLMNTIEIPPNFCGLDLQLPKPCYPDARPDSPEAWPMSDPSRAVALNVKHRQTASAPETPFLDCELMIDEETFENATEDAAELPISGRGTAAEVRRAAMEESQERRPRRERRHRRYSYNAPERERVVVEAWSQKRSISAARRARRRSAPSQSLEPLDQRNPYANPVFPRGARIRRQSSSGSACRLVMDKRKHSQ